MAPWKTDFIIFINFYEIISVLECFIDNSLTSKRQTFKKRGHVENGLCTVRTMSWKIADICDFIRHHFFRKKNKFYFSVHPLWFRMTIWWWSRIIKYYTTCLVSDDVAIQCNRPIKLEHLVKYETIYHTFSSCRRPSQPIGWFQIRHTHFIFDTHIFPFTWCADFTYYFLLFLIEKKLPVISREIEDIQRIKMSDSMSEYFYDGDIMTFFRLKTFRYGKRKGTHQHRRYRSRRFR